MNRDATPDESVRGFSFALETLDDAQVLRALHRPDWEPLKLDWTSAEMRRRIQGGRRQLLPRALGMHKKAELRVVDATAGLGRDGFMLAALGAQVTLLEREPMIAALLHDAQHRALASPLAHAAQRANIVHADACSWLLQNNDAIDAVHLDPMYADHGKSALPQKAMQMLRELTGGDTDAADLLDAALRSKTRRVVVKRSAKAAWLGDREPAYALLGTQARYDIYLVDKDRDSL